MSECAAERRHKRLIRPMLAALSLISFALTYGFRPDALQAVHWWPLALWTPVAFLPWLSLRPWRLWRPISVFSILWLVLLHFEGQLPNLLDQGKQSETIMVVTLNCAGGSVEAAQEAFSTEADVVLLQEVGNRQEFIDEATKHGYVKVIWGLDCAIFSNHWDLSAPQLERDFVAGTLHIRETRVRIVSLRLTPPLFRLDYWNPECWRAYAEDTRARRNRFKEIVGAVGLSDDWIVGGDFNATNPRIVRDTLPRAEEAMRTQGRTWPGTGTNDFPFAPVDQLWSNWWMQAWVRKTNHSDHRMVIAESGYLQR